MKPNPLQSPEFPRREEDQIHDTVPVHDQDRSTNRPGTPSPPFFHGALSTFEKAGFAKDRKIGKHRWVVVKDVTPSSDR
jgi:hypothetical protein